MNQPYDPNSPYGSSNNPYGGSYGDQYGGYGQPDGYGQSGGYVQPGYQQSGPGYGPQPGYTMPGPGDYRSEPRGRPKSRLPVLIAAGLVAALAVGVTLFLVLRDDTKVAGGGGGTDKPSASEVTEQFFQAVDDVDEKKMKAVARGDVLDDVEEIIDQGGTDVVSFADGDLVADASKSVDDIEIAIVVWEIEDPIGDSGESYQLSVGLLDDGDGHKVCYIDEPDTTISGSDDEDTDELLDDWEYDYAEYCDYSG